VTDIQEVVLVRLEGSWSTTYEHDNNRHTFSCGWKKKGVVYKNVGIHLYSTTPMKDLRHVIHFAYDVQTSNVEVHEKPY